MDEMRYALVPAVLVCYICGMNIEKPEEPVAVQVVKGGLITEKWMHKQCGDGLAGKP